MGAEGCQGSRGRRSSTERRRDSENFGGGGGGGRGRVGSRDRRRPCCEGRSPARRGARGPEQADRLRNGGGTLKISTAAGVGSGAGAGGGRAVRVAARQDDFSNLPLLTFFRSIFKGTEALAAGRQ